MILKMAFRNILRHKKRTLLTLITIIFGIFLSIVGDGLNGGLKWQLADIYIKTSTGTIKIYKKGYYNPDEITNQIEYQFENLKIIDEKLKNIKGLINYSKRLAFDGKITNGIVELNTKYIGINLNKEEEIFKRSSMIISGQYFSNNLEEKIIVGKDLAQLLNVKVGDMVTISARSKNGTINAYDVEIKGIIRTGNPSVDINNIFLPLEFGQKLADTKEINDIVLLLKEKNINYLKKKVRQINNIISELDLEAIPWFEEVKDLLGLVAFREKIFSVITFTILLMAGAGIMNTMLMAMLERKKEIGIMMANGILKKEILTLFLAEGVILGIIGSGIGVIIGFFVVSYFQKYGIPIPFSREEIGFDFPIEDKLYMYFDFVKAFGVFLLGVFLAVVSSIYPAIKAIKYEPVECLRD